MLLGSAWDTQSRGAVLKKKITYLAFNCFSVKKLLMERKKQNKTAIPQRTNHGPKNISQRSANVSQSFSDHQSPKRSLLNLFFFLFLSDLLSSSLKFWQDRYIWSCRVILWKVTNHCSSLDFFAPQEEIVSPQGK